MGLERGPLSLVSITEELLEGKSSGFVTLIMWHPVSSKVGTNFVNNCTNEQKRGHISRALSLISPQMQ
jgi:hypothetical protein